jgi:4-hydroxy-tetrahydrodipicolinate synthase
MNTTRRSLLEMATAGAAFAATSKIGQNTGPQFIVAAVTMLDRSGRFDDSMNKDYLALVAEGGADGALALGTTGEFSSFSVKERKQILESFLRHKGKLSILCQVGTPNLPETLDLLAHAAAAGADSALVLPPFYFKNPSVDGLAAFYEPILKAAKVPVLLYNIPQLSGVAITAELLQRLSKFDRLYGMKDSFSKAEPLVAFIREFPKLKILTGVPQNVAADLQAGGGGALTGNGSVLLRETRAVFDTWSKGGDVQAAQKHLIDAGAVFSGYDGIPATKYALSLMGLRESTVRPPFTELSAEKKKELAGRWRGLRG